MPSIFRSLRCSFRGSGVCGILVLSLLGIGSAQAGQSAGGFWQAQSSATAQPALTASQIAQFLPTTRGPFTFPAPYNTTGIRVTLPSDCGGTNCVQYIGYNFWERMSNSAGSNTMWIMVGLGASHGGPTLYKLNKTTNAVTKVGPIFTDSNAYRTGEQMYFSHTEPNRLYYIAEGNQSLNYINVVTHAETTVFNVNDYHSGDYIQECGTSFNDQVSACNLENSNSTRIGCIVYNGKGQHGFQVYYNATYGQRECQPMAGGKYILNIEQTGPAGQSAGSSVIINAQTGSETRIVNSLGGNGHYGLGYGNYVEVHNLDPIYSVARLWSAAAASTHPVGDVADIPYRDICNYNPTVCSEAVAHPSWLDAVPAAVEPIANQYVCDSTASVLDKPFSNQVYCYYLSASSSSTPKQAFVIAPTMIRDTATGGCANGNGEYGNQPKGNIDPTGHYFIWSANLDTTNNCQVFIVKIPTGSTGLTPPPAPSTSPPQVSITNPPNAATVFGTVAAKANVSADVQIANVTWEIDGQQVASTDTAPYTYNLNTDNLAMGTHTLTAVATDIAGNAGTATNNIVVAQAPAVSGKGGGGGSLSLLPLAALGLLVAVRARAQARLKRAA